MRTAQLEEGAPAFCLLPSAYCFLRRRKSLGRDSIRSYSVVNANIKKCSVLVTGGAGFIGSHVVERLLTEADYAVTIVDDFNDFYDPVLKWANIAQVIGHPDVQLVKADILDQEALPELFDSRRFDCIIHLAARAGVRPSLKDPLLYQRVNVEGTYRLLDLAARHGVAKFIFGSSSSVYGLRSRVPFSEIDPVNQPASPYAATKIAGESACHVYSHLYDMQVLCLRFFTVFGPRQRPDLAIHKFTSLMANDQPVTLYGDGRSGRDYTYIDDVVDCIVKAMAYNGSPFEIINVGGERPTKLLDLVLMIADALAVEPRIEWAVEQPGDIPLTYADGRKARQLLGFEPKVRIEEGINRFVKWFLDRRETASMPIPACNYI